ncbi:hypothetical protein CI109_101797 [Kwoniella shandongensis]|uniref:Asl1-like glycosyl hydrolase catalytic domain-containing protein n=1 Tax=Kwoniella shandongensis TaxID=1734106 RepID=A0A5M6C655_9TREE|nr:uncharacterized protein CI109_001081 [Kwoniella shandongensis]KAA5530281.1 hypothetical protein CI109_001081 [Kwoniella shandongensis]
MVALPTLSLLLLLPTLALGSHNSPLEQRSPVRNHQHRARAGAFNHIHARSYPGSIEEKMAKKALGKELAKRKADPSKCRVRNSTWTAATFRLSGSTSTVISSNSSVTSTTSLASSTSAVASSTTDATTTTSSANVDGAQAWAAPTSSDTPAPAKTSASTTPPSSGGWSSATPNGNKAGVSAGDSLPYLKGKLGWWYDWSPNPSGDAGGAVAVPMIWGGGTADGEDAVRLSSFQSMGSVPQYIIGFEEPDCPAGSGSAGMDVETGIHLWNQDVAPKGDAGSYLVSPSMCKQAAESGWLQPFLDGVTRKPDAINVHCNKVDRAGIEEVLNHYAKYGLPLWITEFACVDDQNGFTPCTDQAQIDSFINTAVEIFESDSRVAAYAYSNGYGLGNVWPMMSGGSLSASGQTYLNAISKYH